MLTHAHLLYTGTQTMPLVLMFPPSLRSSTSIKRMRRTQKCWCQRCRPCRIRPSTWRTACLQRPASNWTCSQHWAMLRDSWRLHKVSVQPGSSTFAILPQSHLSPTECDSCRIDCMTLWMSNLKVSSWVCLSLRSDPAEGPGDQGPKAEDSWGDGCHAQHLLHSWEQQHDSRGPPLLLQLHGHKSLRPGPKCLHLPATQKVNAPSNPSFSFFNFLSWPPDLLGRSDLFCFSMPDPKDVVLWLFIVV